MASVVKTESGIDLLQRLSVRPKLCGLQVDIFGENGPEPGDVIEISEKNTCLKTLLMTQWIMNCILPSTWNGIKIGGFDAGVVLLSTDHQFSILQLVALLEKKLKRILRQCQAVAPGSGTTIIKEITKESLKRLSVFESFNKTELLFNFCAVKTHILSHPKTSVVFIDSLSAYYWEDRLSSSFQSLDKHCQYLLKYLVERLKQTNIIIIYTIQRFLRDIQEKETTDPPIFIYSLSIENQPQLVMNVEDRRNATSFMKNIKILKGDIYFE